MLFHFTRATGHITAHGFLIIIIHYYISHWSDLKLLILFLKISELPALGDRLASNYADCSALAAQFILTRFTASGQRSFPRTRPQAELSISRHSRRVIASAMPSTGFSLNMIYTPNWWRWNHLAIEEARYFSISEFSRCEIGALLFDFDCGFTRFDFRTTDDTRRTSERFRNAKQTSTNKAGAKWAKQ
jgi:hypothetical protein